MRESVIIGSGAGRLGSTARRSVGIAVAAALMIAGTALVAASAVTSAADWSVPQIGGRPLATADGNVLAIGAGDSNPTNSALQKLTPAGARLWQLPPNSSDRPVTGFAATTDASGNTYVGLSDGSLASFDGSGTRRWRTAPLTAGCCTFVALGWDGNVYTSTGGSSGASHVVGTDQVTGARRVDLPLGNVTGLYAYSGGLIVVDSSSSVSYYSYQGSLLSGPFSGGRAVDLQRGYSSASGGAGAVFLAGYGSGVSGFVPGVVKITPSGLQWTWTGAVSVGNQPWVAATPDGGVILAGVDNSFISISPTGSSRWTYTPAPPKGQSSPGSLPVVDTDGRVVLPFNYQFATDTFPQSQGAQVEFLTQSSVAPVMPPLSVESDSCAPGQGGRGTSLYGVTGLGSGGPADIGPNRLYLGLDDFCTGVTRSGSVRGYTVSGLGANYRLTLATPPATGGPGTTTTTSTTTPRTTPPPSGEVTVSPSEGRPGTTFGFSYICPVGGAPRLAVLDAQTDSPAAGVTIGIPSTDNGREYTQGVTASQLGTYVGRVTCRGQSAGSATFVVKPARTYAALGDSYSSGEGNEPFDPDSLADGCHRSANAWPRLVGKSAPNIVMVGHIACSGATTTALVGTYNGEPPQLIQLRLLATQPDVITITIGGNDAGFANVVGDCFVADCVYDGTVATARKAIDRLAITLPVFYRAIRAVSPKAQLVAVGYPRLFPSTQREATGCGWLTPAERENLNKLTSKLNGVIAVAAAQAGAKYAPVQEALNGHELCSANSWVNPILGPFSGSGQAHPNLPGQQAIENAVLLKL